MFEWMWMGESYLNDDVGLKNSDGWSQNPGSDFDLMSWTRPYIRSLLSTSPAYVLLITYFLFLCYDTVPLVETIAIGYIISLSANVPLTVPFSFTNELTTRRFLLYVVLSYSSIVDRTGRTMFYHCGRFFDGTRSIYIDVRPLDTNIESIFQVPSSCASWSVIIMSSSTATSTNPLSMQQSHKVKCSPF